MIVGQGRYYGAFLALLLSWLLCFYSSIASMVTIWATTETFAHGFLIFPIVIYLIWDKRGELEIIEWRSNPFSLIALICLLLLWLLAVRLGVQVIEQLAAVALIPVFVLMVFGTRVFKIISFPLAYLFFAVPFGEFLIPSLQQITGDICVWLLKASGMSVFKEGNYISTPEAMFEVAWTCSGIRYLIASTSLGTLFAYLNFTSPKKRLFFSLFAIGLPVLANGLRAYSIVMLYTYVDKRFAQHLDHLIYGWVLFGVIILLLFLIGRWFGDREMGREKIASLSTVKPANKMSYWHTLSAIGVTLLISALPGWMAMNDAKTNYLPMSTPAAASYWVSSDTVNSVWTPQYKWADRSINALYKKQGKEVFLYIAKYDEEKQGKELVNIANRLFDTSRWRLLSESRQTLLLGTRSLEVEQKNLSGPGGDLVIWSWYRVGEQNLISPWMTKLHQFIDAPFSKSQGAVIAIATSGEQADISLTEFIQDHWAEVFAVVDKPLNMNHTRIVEQQHGE